MVFSSAGTLHVELNGAGGTGSSTGLSGSLLPGSLPFLSLPPSPQAESSAKKIVKRKKQKWCEFVF